MSKEKKSAKKTVEFKELTVNGETFRTTFTKKYENRKPYEAPNEKHILSVIPGTIVSVYANEGDKVKKGDEMIVFEAMKMKNTMTYPFNGTISKVNVKAGESVPKGKIMIEFE